MTHVSPNPGRATCVFCSTHLSAGPSSLSRPRILPGPPRTNGESLVVSVMTFGTSSRPRGPSGRLDQILAPHPVCRNRARGASGPRPFHCRHAPRDGPRLSKRRPVRSQGFCPRGRSWCGERMAGALRRAGFKSLGSSASPKDRRLCATEVSRRCRRRTSALPNPRADFPPARSI